MDPSSFIKLKALKVIPTDTNSPNIMRLYFPRNKNAERAIKINVKSDNSKSSEPTTSSGINQFSEKDLKKDFIEVDDILLVHDPKNIDALLKDQQIDEVSSVTPESPTLQSTQSAGDSKPEKKNLEALFNQSLRYKKLVNSFNANKSGKPDSFYKSTTDRGLFKREGNLNDQIKDIPDASNKDTKPDNTSMNRDFEIVSSAIDSTEAPASRRVENSTEIIGQIQTTTEASVKETMKEGSEVQDQTTEASSDDGEMVGVSLKDLQTDEKNLEIDQIKIANLTKALQADEQRLSDDKEKRDIDKSLLETDKSQFIEDKAKFLVDSDLNDQTTNTGGDDGEIVGVSLKDMQTDEKNLEVDQKKVADDTKQVQDDEQKLNVDKEIRDIDKAFLEMDKSQFTTDKDKFLADLESSGVEVPPSKIENQLMTTEKPDIKQTVSKTEAPKIVEVQLFI